MEKNVEQKVQTKYERKMEERKKQEEKDKKASKRVRIIGIAVCVVIIVAIIAAVVISVNNKKTSREEVFIEVGNHEVTKLEYDYYYNQILNSYSYVMAYAGMDIETDLDTPYSEDLTWRDFMHQLTAEQIAQIKALTDQAAEKGFEYDVTEDYKNAMDGLKTGAENAGVTLAQFYKSSYGDYATEKNMEPLIKETLLSNAYYAHLKEQVAPTEQEIESYYKEKTLEYDKVDYYEFIFTTDLAEDASEEEIDKAMAEAKEKADAMMAARKEGADFKELCIQNASQEDKATYEDTEKDIVLNEGVYYYATPSVTGDWLYEEGRVEGDIAVMEDNTNHQYYVVEFIKKYCDDADYEKIKETVISNQMFEKVEQLKENYPITDTKGTLKYLTIENADTAQ